MRDGYNDESLVIEDCSLPGCTELNPWLPTDENMPTNTYLFTQTTRHRLACSMALQMNRVRTARIGVD